MMEKELEEEFMSKHMDRVKELRASVTTHYNCAQSVLIPFAEDLGMDAKLACQIAANFGAGMKSGSVCGAITGGLMVLGLYDMQDAESTKKLFELVREKHNGYTDCKDLLRDSAEHGIARKPHCDGLVYEIVEALDEMLG